MTFAEIGRELGISESEAKKIFKRALAKLRRRRGTLKKIRHLLDEMENVRLVRVGGEQCSF